MLLRDLTKVYISEYEEIEDHGETYKKWKAKGKESEISNINNNTVETVNKMTVAKINDNSLNGIAFLNLQQDVNELDRKSTGEVDYSIYKGRTTRDYDIQKGNGISFEDISKLTDFKPDYKVTQKNKIGNTYIYIMEKVQ